MEKWIADGLIKLCRCNTSLRGDLEELRSGERDCRDVYVELVRDFISDDATIYELGFPEDLTSDPYYTVPHYAGSELSRKPEVIYRNRKNLFIRNEATTGGRRWLLNAHIDTVPPFIAPTRGNDKRIYGRGAVDNKAGMMTAAVVTRLLSELRQAGLCSALPPVDLLMVLDEEMGGNGSLASVLQMDSPVDTVVVLEPTRLMPHPANRGALWFRVALEAKAAHDQMYLFPAMASIVGSLAEQGMRIRRESDHPLFSPEDVQTCFGVLESFGEYPASACSKVRFVVSGDDLTQEALETFVEEVISSAVSDGSITHRTDSPALTRIDPTDTHRAAWNVEVAALDGHMGSRGRDSDAILKMSHLIRAIQEEGRWSVNLPESSGQLVLEGGQGFVPTHTLSNVQERLASTVAQTLARFAREHDLKDRDLVGQISFDKLHNEAYCSSPESKGGPALASAFAAIAGAETPALTGWQVSCDARIFARECEDVVTFGPGSLDVAHSDGEYVDIDEILLAACMLTLAIIETADE